MKSITIILILLSSTLLLADPKPLRREPRPESIDWLFFDTLDPQQILRDYPPKFVEMKEVESTPFETIGKYYAEERHTVKIPGIMYKDAPVLLGTVLSGYSSEEINGPSSRVLVDMEVPLVVNRTYSILRPGPKLKNTSSKTYYQFYYNGDAKVIDFDTKSVAVIRTSQATIARTGDILVAKLDSLKEIDFASGIINENFSARAEILSVSEEKSHVIGHDGFVFLDKGKNDGVLLNQRLRVYLDPATHQLKGNDTSPIGEIQIVDLTDFTSTAYVVHCSQEVSVGDYATGN